MKKHQPSRYQPDKWAKGTLALTAFGTAFWLFMGHQTGEAAFYWVSAINACVFFFVVGAEYGISLWRPLAEDAIDLNAQILSTLKKMRGK